MSNLKQLIEELQHPDEGIRRMACEDLGYLRDADAIQPLSLSLSDSSRAVSEAAAESLIMIGTEEVVNAMSPLMGSPEISVRNYAREILSDLGEISVEALLKELKNPDRDVRKFAIDALDHINSKRCIPALLDAINDEDVNISYVAAEMLGRLGDENVIPYLQSHMADIPWMKGACLRALGEIGTPSAHEIVTQVLDSEEDPLVLLSGIQALGRIASPKSISVLIKFLKEKPQLFAEEIVVSLEKILTENRDVHVIDYLDDLSIEPLYNVALQGESSIRIKAVQLIGQMRSQHSIPFLTQLFFDEDGEIRKSALKAMVDIYPVDISPVLKILDNPEAPMTAKANALDGLGRLKKQESVSWILKFLESDHITLQRVALDALFLPVSDETKQYLARMLTSPIDEIIEHTLTAIQRLDIPELEQQVIECLGHRSQEVCEAANATLIGIIKQKKTAYAYPYLRYFDARERHLAYKSFGNPIEISHDEMLNRLQEGLSRPEINIKKIAIKGIANLDLDHAVKWLEPLLKDPIQEIVLSVIQIYGHLGTDHCRHVLENMLAVDSPVNLKSAIIDALGEIRNPASVSCIVSNWNSEDMAVKFHILKALKMIGSSEASEGLKTIYSEEENDDILEVIEDLLNSLDNGV
ncbi:MAG: HEAT repeat domain-containing protein [SAR324 cluster bacterium]|nr:HEAT repeat domain-containing protein [SAR324 cluster bacterium]